MSNDQVKHLNDESFEAAVEKGIVLVDFWAPWCGPCQMQGPILEDVAAQVGEAVTIAKVNVEEAPLISSQFDVRSIPTLLLFRDKQVVQTFLGVQSAATLLRAIESAQGEAVVRE